MAAVQGDGSVFGEARSCQLELLATALSVLRVIGDPPTLAQSVADLLTATSVRACRIDLDHGTGWPTAVWSHRGAASRGRSAPEHPVGDGDRSVRPRLAVDPGTALTWAILPLVAQRKTLGTLSVALSPEDPDLRARDLGHLERIAAALAAALVRGEAYDRALELSKSLQQSLLPTELPVAGWVSVSGRYLAATASMNIGGDWYDAQLLPSGELALSVGDAAGHGVEAAARMGEIRSAVNTLRLLSHAPDDLITSLHRVSEVSGYFATTICGRLYRGGLFVWSSAGHLPPILLRPDGETTVLYGEQSPPLGTGFSGPVMMNRRMLAPGDALILYTDGLVERRDEPIDASVDRLAEQIATRPGADPEELVEYVVAARQATGPTSDDIAVIAARYETPETA